MKYSNFKQVVIRFTLKLVLGHIEHAVFTGSIFHDLAFRETTMKLIKHLSMVAVMTLIFTLTTSAGVIHTGVLPPPPPPPSEQSLASGSTDGTSAMSARQGELAPGTLEAEILLLFLQMLPVY
jgi:hypothetical protein